MRATLIALALVCAGLAASPARAVMVQALASDFEFADDSTLDVVFEVTDAPGLTGLEFSVIYPSDLLAIAEPSTHVSGTLFSHGYVNHDADSSDLPAGWRRIRVVNSVAVPVTQESGMVVTLSFPVRCSDFSGDWPDGRTVSVQVQDAAAWKASGEEVPQPVPVDVQDASINVNCTTVPTAGFGFSTLKARHTGRGGSR